MFLLVLNGYSGYLLCLGPSESEEHLYAKGEGVLWYCIILNRRDTADPREAVPSKTHHHCARANQACFNSAVPGRQGKRSSHIRASRGNILALLRISYGEDLNIHGCPEESCQQRVACWQSTDGNGPHGPAESPHLVRSLADQEGCNPYRAGLLGSWKTWIIYQAVYNIAWCSSVCSWTWGKLDILRNATHCPKKYKEFLVCFIILAMQNFDLSLLKKQQMSNSTIIVRYYYNALPYKFGQRLRYSCHNSPLWCARLHSFYPIMRSWWAPLAKNSADDGEAAAADSQIRRLCSNEDIDESSKQVAQKHILLIYTGP